MNNNIHPSSARGYYGPSYLVMPNYWTPWQQQPVMYSLRPLPAWMHPTVPQAINPYMPFRAMICGAAPQVMQSVQLPRQFLGKASESCLFGLRDHMGQAVQAEILTETAAPRQQIPTQAYGDPEAQRGEPSPHAPYNLTSVDSVKEDRAELYKERTAPTKRERTRKMVGARKKRRPKSDATRRGSLNRKQEVVDGDAGSGKSATSAGRKRQSKAEQAGVEPQGSTPKCNLHERIADSIRVYHRLGDKTTKPSPLHSTQRVVERSGNYTLPLKTKAQKRKREGKLGFQDCTKTFPGISTSSLGPRCSLGNTPAVSIPELTAESFLRSTHIPRSLAVTLGRWEQVSCGWPTFSVLTQDGCPPHTFPMVLEESTPIQAWQREEREAMKMEAQKQREQAARVTKMGLDYAIDSSLGLDTFHKLFCSTKKIAPENFLSRLQL